MTVQSGAGVERVPADHYVAALPVERLRLLRLARACARPSRGSRALPRLVVRWMNGVMFYLDRDVPLQHGHAIFIDSEWALTAISQAQFWPDVDLEQRGDGRVEGILSVDVSEWERPGPADREGRDGVHAARRSARRCGASSPTTSTTARSRRRNVVAWFLDPAIEFPNPTAATNLEPLLINTAGSWADRPDAVTRIPNLFLAADFVRTHTDLATMEGANEAARRAVNGILDASGLARAALQGLEAARAGRAGAASGRSTAALAARPPAGGAAAAGRRRTGGIEPAGRARARAARRCGRRVTTAAAVRAGRQAASRDASAFRTLSDVVLAIAAEREVEPVLQRLVHAARELGGARYAALGVPDGEGAFARFITSGMSDELIAAMGPLPRTHGMLGAMLESAEPYRTADIHADPRFRGWWPRAHPDMRSFLGVPIVLARRRSSGRST